MYDDLTDRLRQEHHSAWTWAHDALAKLLAKIRPAVPAWQQVGLMEWEAEVGDRTLTIRQTQDGRYTWSNFGPINESGICASLEDAKQSVEKTIK